MQNVYLIPAYGRSYKSKSLALADWNDNRDFKIYQGPYTSKTDLPSLKKQFNSVILWWNYPSQNLRHKL